MKRVLLAEYHKVLPYRTLWIVLALYALLVPAIVLGVGQFLEELALPVARKVLIFSFPDVWHWVSFFAGFFTRLLAMLVIILVANEFKYGTFKQNIIDGYSRTAFWSGKAFLVLNVSLVGVVVCAITAIVLGAIYSSGEAMGRMGEMSGFLLAFWIQCLGHCSMALFIAVLLRSGALAIVIYLLYSLVVEYIFVAFTPEAVRSFLPVYALSETIEMPWRKFIISAEQSEDWDVKSDMIKGTTKVFNKAFFISLGYIALFWLASFFLLQKRDPGK